MKMFNVLLITLLFSLTAIAQVTASDEIQIGKPGSTANKVIKFGAGRGAKPGIRFNNTNSKLEFSNDASIFKALGSGSGSGAGINLLDNPGFEDGITSNWVTSGTPLVAVTSGVNLLFDLISASWTPTAAGHFWESTPIVVPNGLYGAACMVEVWYQGGDANAYLTVFTASAEYIPSTARATLNATAGMKKAKVYFDCPSSGSLKLRVQSTAAMAIGYFDKGHLGQADFAQSKQSSYVGKSIIGMAASCAFTTNSATFINYGAVAACPTPIGNLAPSTKIPAVTIPLAQKGTYYFTATSKIQKQPASDGVASFRFSDGVNSSGATAIRNNTSFAGGGVVVGAITLPNDTANWTVNLQATATSGVNAVVEIDNSGAANSNDLTIEVFFYPSGTDSIVNSKCVNDISCENNFSSSVAAGGVVSQENLDWISGNCTSPITGQIVCSYNSGVFVSGLPNCSITPIGSNTYPIVESNTTSGIIYSTFNNSNVRTASAVYFSCQKTGTDFKAKQNIQGFFSDHPTSSISNSRIEFVKFGGVGATNCTTTPCTIAFSSPAVSSVSRASAGGYNVSFLAGTWANTNFMCTGSCVKQGVTQDCIVSSNATSTTVMNITSVVTGAASDSEVQLQCVGTR
jgi:hypothetical protein